MKKPATLLSSIIFLVLSAYSSPHAAAQSSYTLKKSQIQKITVAKKTITCGLIGKTWKVVSKSGSKYKLVSKANKAAKSGCSKLLAKGALKSLTSIPSTSAMASAARSSKIPSSFAVSGTPPALISIGEGSIKNLFWNTGIIDTLSTGTPSGQQCGEFFGSGTDGTSGGLSACYMTQGVGYSFENVLRSGTSLCYMKKFPTEANLTAGGLAINSGTLPSGGITALFSPPAGTQSRTVKIAISGFSEGSSNEVNAKEGGPEIIFISIPGVGTNERAGNAYKAELWFCSANGGQVNSAERVTVKLSGELIAESLGNEGGNGTVESTVRGFLIRSGDTFSFDSTKARTASVEFSRSGSAFKSHIKITGDNRLYNKVYDSQDTNTRKGYTVADFSGSNLSTLRFLSGGYKDVNSFGGEVQVSTPNIVEFRETQYVVANNEDLSRELDRVTISTDAFFATTASPNPDLSRYSCSATPDVSLTMDFSNATLASSVADCEGERLDNMNYCNEDADVSTAMNRYFSVCN